MWASVLLLAVFTILLATAGLLLRRLQTSKADRPAHHAAPQKTASPRHAHA